jgi:hypothetical protein
MSDFSRLYNLYLHAAHLPPDQVVQVTIEKASIETLHPRPGQETQSLVLAFNGKQRKLVVNNSQASALADLAGSTDTAALVGLVIGLRRVKYGKLESIQISEPPKNGTK